MLKGMNNNKKTLKKELFNTQKKNYTIILSTIEFLISHEKANRRKRIKFPWNVYFQSNQN